jgi:glucoamylase
MRKIITLLLLTITFNCFAKNSDKVNTKKINYETSIQYLLDNINPAGTMKGTVIASPSRANPDYFYHWVRDAALVMNTVFEAALKETNQDRKETLFNVVYDYVARVKNNQLVSGFWNLGEPKYHVDGRAFTGPWGRPQHDGPGLRAITLINFANYLLNKGDAEYVASNLYSPVLPALSPIKQDLEYVAQHWNKQGFDYWEEVMGLHFSTAMSHRKALIQGAQLARRLGDVHAAVYYESVAKNVEFLINKFWSDEKAFIQATLFQTRGVSKSQLDISVILGVHHGDNNDGFYSVGHPLVLKTITKIENTFRSLYQINSTASESIGNSIGRYPEDTYNGYRTDDVGHGWFLATFAMAEFHLRLAKNLERKYYLTNTTFYCSLIKLSNCEDLIYNPLIYKTAIIKALRTKANAFFNRSDIHAANDGRMSEQIIRYYGYMEGAKDLTWSYASHISALLQQ